MPEFLEERISGLVRMGASYVDEYAVDIVTTAGSQEFRTLVHPFPVRKFDVSYMLDAAATYAELQALYHRAHGRFAGFRARCADEWSSNGRVGTPTALDQTCAYVSGNIWQLRKYYGKDKAAGASGYPYRTIFKPVAGTVKMAAASYTIAASNYTVDTTTGRVTFTPKQANISNIAKYHWVNGYGTITFSTAHPFVVGDSVVLSGVGGMGTINGMRLAVSAVPTSTTIRYTLDNSYMADYTSGGVAQVQPLSSETVSAGFEFDFPVRFNTALPIGQDFVNMRPVEGVELIELLQP